MTDPQDLVKKFCRKCGWAGMVKRKNNYCTSCHKHELTLDLAKAEIFVPVDADTSKRIRQIGLFTDLSAGEIIGLAIKIISVLVELVSVIVDLKRGTKIVTRNNVTEDPQTEEI